MGIAQKTGDFFYPAAYHIGNLERYYLFLTGSAYGSGAVRYSLGNKKAFTIANRMASFYVRAHGNAIRGALLGRGPGFFGTQLTTSAGSRTVGQMAARLSGAAAIGYGLGTAIGSGISYLAWGESGAQKAWDLYKPGGASFLREGLYDMPSNAWYIANTLADNLSG